jgi:hypothetical protein
MGHLVSRGGRHAWTEASADRANRTCNNGVGESRSSAQDGPSAGPASAGGAAGGEIWLSVLVRKLITARQFPVGRGPALAGARFHRLFQPHDGQTVQMDLLGKATPCLTHSSPARSTPGCPCGLPKRLAKAVTTKDCVSRDAQFVEQGLRANAESLVVCAGRRMFHAGGSPARPPSKRGLKPKAGGTPSSGLDGVDVKGEA